MDILFKTIAATLIILICSACGGGSSNTTQADLADSSKQLQSSNNESTSQETDDSESKLPVVRDTKNNPPETKTSAPTAFDEANRFKFDDSKIDWPSLISNATGNSYLVSSKEDFSTLTKTAQPGDVILIEDGTYNWENLVITSKGTKDNPIIYTALNPGKVTFENATKLFKIIGDWNIIGGFTIKNITNEVFNFTGSKGLNTVGASNNRVTDNYITKSGAPTSQDGCNCWMIQFMNRANQNRLDHNHFYQNYGFIRVVIATDALENGPSQDNRVDHNKIENSIGDRVPAFQIGNCAYCDPGSEFLDARTVFEHNEIINHVARYGEIVTNKSSGNIIRYNTFLNSYGGISLRMGNSVQIYGNFFDGGTSTGITISGAYHRVFNNIFNSPNKDAPIIMWRSGVRPNAGKGAALMPTHHNIIANNTILGATKYGIRINDCNNGACDPVHDSTIANNIIVGNSGTLFHYDPTGATNVVISNNMYWNQGTAIEGDGYTYDLNPILSDPKITTPQNPPAGTAGVNNGVLLSQFGNEDIVIDHNGNSRLNPGLGAL